MYLIIDQNTFTVDQKKRILPTLINFKLLI
jgi:hypothetical protein